MATKRKTGTMAKAGKAVTKVAKKVAKKVNAAVVKPAAKALGVTGKKKTGAKKTTAKKTTKSKSK
jgi:hypothetical protein